MPAYATEHTLPSGQAKSAPAAVHAPAPSPSPSPSSGFRQFGFGFNRFAFVPTYYYPSILYSGLPYVGPYVQLIARNGIGCSTWLLLSTQQKLQLLQRMTNGYGAYLTDGSISQLSQLSQLVDADCINSQSPILSLQAHYPFLMRGYVI